MKNRNVSMEKNRLDDLFFKVSSIQDINLKTELSGYLAIKVSGFLEYSLRELLVDYSNRVSNRNVASFVEKELKSRTNLKMEKFAQLLGSFSPQWETTVRSSSDFALYKEALNTIVDARNNLSHGKSVTITFARVNEHYKSIVKLLELVELQL